MIGFLIDVGIFSNLFYTGYVLFDSPFEFYISYLPIILLLPVFIIKYKFYAPSLYIIIPLLVFGLFNIFIGNNTSPRFLKIFLNISVNLVFYQYVMQYYNYDIKLIFRKYLYISFLMCALGLFQLASYWVGFLQGYKLSLIFPLTKWGLNLGGLGIRINSLLIVIFIKVDWRKFWIFFFKNLPPGSQKKSDRILQKILLKILF